jgi:hypothetical protein
MKRAFCASSKILCVVQCPVTYRNWIEVPFKEAERKMVRQLHVVDGVALAHWCGLCCLGDGDMYHVGGAMHVALST